MIQRGLCVFDFTTDEAYALRCREAKLSCFYVNDPVQAAVERWNHPGVFRITQCSVMYLRTEYFKINHFMYTNYTPVGGKANGPHRMEGINAVGAFVSMRSGWNSPLRRNRSVPMTNIGTFT